MESIDAVLGDQIRHHGPSQYQVVGDSNLYQGISPPGGKWGEDDLINALLHHGFGYVVCTSKGEASVYRKGIDDTCNESSRIAGQIGEIVDDTVRYLNTENEGICQNIQRIEDGVMNNNQLSLRAMAFGDTYHFRNPYWPLGFNDDEIALALCLEDACQGKGYSLADALQDSYLAQCMQKSCSEKRTLVTESQIWSDGFVSALDARV